jgi:hypothetical protein
MSLTHTINTTKWISKDIYAKLSKSELYNLTIDCINKILYDTIKDRIKKTYLITSGSDKDIRMIITYNNNEYLLITEKPHKILKESLHDLMKNADSLCENNCYLKEELFCNELNDNVVEFSNTMNDSFEYEKIQYHLIPAIKEVINQHKDMGILHIVYGRYQLHKTFVDMYIKK